MRLGLSNFTVCNGQDVSVGGVPLSHRLYPLAFSHSGRRYSQLALGGGSFQTLSEGMQDALWMISEVPAEHCSESLLLRGACSLGEPAAPQRELPARADTLRIADEGCAKQIGQLIWSLTSRWRSTAISSKK